MNLLVCCVVYVEGQSANPASVELPVVDSSRGRHLDSPAGDVSRKGRPGITRQRALHTAADCTRRLISLTDTHTHTSGQAGHSAHVLAQARTLSGRRAIWDGHVRGRAGTGMSRIPFQYARLFFANIRVYFRIIEFSYDLLLLRSRLLNELL